MARGDNDVTTIKASSVTCAGRPGAPHDPVDLELAVGQTLACPVCGSPYRRVGTSWAVETASWPKSE